MNILVTGAGGGIGQGVIKSLKMIKDMDIKIIKQKGYWGVFEKNTNGEYTSCFSSPDPTYIVNELTAMTKDYEDAK